MCHGLLCLSDDRECVHYWIPEINPIELAMDGFHLVVFGLSVGYPIQQCFHWNVHQARTTLFGSISCFLLLHFFGVDDFVVLRRHKLLK